MESCGMSGDVVDLLMMASLALEKGRGERAVVMSSGQRNSICDATCARVTIAPHCDRPASQRRQSPKESEASSLPGT